MKKRHTIHRLRKYFQLIIRSKEVPKAELLSSNEALKAFGALGIHYKGDLMLMMALIEYEYGRNKNYTKGDIIALKKTLVEVYKFMTACGEEWEVYEREQAKKTIEN